MKQINNNNEDDNIKSNTESQENLQTKQQQQQPIDILTANASQFDKDKRDVTKLLLLLKGDMDISASPGKTVLTGMNQYKTQQKIINSGDPQMDWFNFETRIRKVIYDVIEPLTRKQFQTFDGIDDMKKQIKFVQDKYEETLQRIDRVIKRNESFERLDKYTRELEQDLYTMKALQKNDMQQILEKLETWGARWKATQNDVNNFHKYDDKIMKVQKSLQDVTEQYKISVTQRFKEMSSEFMKSIIEVEQSNRDIKIDMQELMVKVQSVKEFTQNSDIKFQNLGTLIDSLRETIENSRFTHTYAQSKLLYSNETSHREINTQHNNNNNNNILNNNNNISQNTLQKYISINNTSMGQLPINDSIKQMQQEINSLRQDNQQMDTIIRPQQQKLIQKIDERDIKRLVFQSQVEMYEQVFGQQFGVKKVQDYQGYTYQNYIDWRTNLIDKFEKEDAEQRDQEDNNTSQSQRQRSKRVPFWKVYALEQHQTNNDLQRRFSITKVPKSKLQSYSPPNNIQQQQKEQIMRKSSMQNYSPLQRKFSILLTNDQISIVNELDLQQKQQQNIINNSNKKLSQQVEQQETNNLQQDLIQNNNNSSNGKQSKVNSNDIPLLNLKSMTQDIEHTNSQIQEQQQQIQKEQLDNINNDFQQDLNLTVRLTKSNQENDLIIQSQEIIINNNLIETQNNIQQDQQNQNYNEDQNLLQNLQEEFNESFDEEDFQQILRKLQDHPSFMTQDKILEVVEMSAQFLNNKFQDQINDIKNRFEIKLSQQDKVVDIISSVQKEMKEISSEFKSFKNHEQIQALQNLVNRTEANFLFMQKDLQQQIYKLKEFDEQLYHKQIEFDGKIDLEIIKIKRERSDLQIHIDKVGKEIQGLKLEDGKLQDQMQQLGEVIGTLIELSTIQIAIQQQDEMEKKLNQSQFLNNNANNINQYYDNIVSINNQSYQKSHLIHSMKVLLESEWLGVISLKPFKQLYQDSENSLLNNSLIAFNEQLNQKLNKICQDYQQKQDILNQELERQNKGLPKEILKIKEAFEGKTQLQQYQQQLQRKSVRKVDINNNTSSKRDLLNMSAVALDNHDLLDYGILENLNNSTSNIKTQKKINQIGSYKSMSPTRAQQNRQLRSHNSNEQLLQNNINNIMPEISIMKKSKNLVNKDNMLTFNNTSKEFTTNTQISPFSNNGKKLIEQAINNNIEPQVQQTSQFKSNSQMKKYSISGNNNNIGVNSNVNRSFNIMNSNNNIHSINDLPRQKLPLKGSLLLNKQPIAQSQNQQQNTLNYLQQSSNSITIPTNYLQNSNLSHNNNNNILNKTTKLQQSRNTYNYQNNNYSDDDNNNNNSLMLVPLRGNNIMQQNNTTNNGSHIGQYNFSIKEENYNVVKKNTQIAIGNQHNQAVANNQQMPKINNNQKSQQRNQL